MRPKLRFEGNLDLHITAGHRRTDCGGYPLGVLLDLPPLGAACEHHEGDAAQRQVLLVANASIRGEDASKPA
jgi:hypothetical protein